MYFLCFDSFNEDWKFFIVKFSDTKKSHFIYTQIWVHLMKGIPFFSLAYKWWLSLLPPWPCQFQTAWDHPLVSLKCRGCEEQLTEPAPLLGSGTWAVVQGCLPSVAQRMVLARWSPLLMSLSNSNQSCVFSNGNIFIIFEDYRWHIVPIIKKIKKIKQGMI